MILLRKVGFCESVARTGYTASTVMRVWKRWTEQVERPFLLGVRLIIRHHHGATDSSFLWQRRGVLCPTMRWNNIEARLQVFLYLSSRFIHACYAMGCIQRFLCAGLS